MTQTQPHSAHSAPYSTLWYLRVRQKRIVSSVGAAPSAIGMPFALVGKTLRPCREFDVGGLAWAYVKPLIEQHLGDLSIPIFVYATYHAGMKAKETVETLVR